jgi:hypothetical protein
VIGLSVGIEGGLVGISLEQDRARSSAPPRSNTWSSRLPGSRRLAATSSGTRPRTVSQAPSSLELGRTDLTERRMATPLENTSRIAARYSLPLPTVNSVVSPAHR